MWALGPWTTLIIAKTLKFMIIHIWEINITITYLTEIKYCTNFRLKAQIKIRFSVRPRFTPQNNRILMMKIRSVNLKVLKELIINSMRTSEYPLCQMLRTNLLTSKIRKIRSLKIQHKCILLLKEEIEVPYLMSSDWKIKK